MVTIKTPKKQPMKKTIIILIWSCLFLAKSHAQNQPSSQKEKIAEFRTLFIQNIQLQGGSLSDYKNINFNINACTIEIKTIDFENSKDENVTITLPTLGAMLKENGELYYKNKVIIEIIENKVTKKATTHLYNNSMKIGLILKLENQEKFKIMQEKLNELSSYCKLEKKY